MHVETEKAPGAIGPYSQAVKTDTMVFVSGQLALDPASGNLISDDIQTETRQALNNLKSILEAAGSNLEKAVKVTVFIKNMDDFPEINSDTFDAFAKNAYKSKGRIFKITKAEDNIDSLFKRAGLYEGD